MSRAIRHMLREGRITVSFPGGYLGQWCSLSDLDPKSSLVKTARVPWPGPLSNSRTVVRNMTTLVRRRKRS